MGYIYKVLAGMGTLIAIYLFLSNWTATVQILDTAGTVTGNTVQILQGRKNYMR